MNINEKAKSRAQQRLMGAVLNAKRTGEASTPEVAKLALTMKTRDVKDIAKTKHKRLPEKVAENIKIEDVKGNLAFEVIDIIKPGSLEPTKQIVHWEDPTKNNNVNEKLSTFGDGYDRSEKANKERDLRMKHGKSWGEFTDAAIKAKENREKENRDYADRRNRGIVAYSKNRIGKVVKGRIKGGKFRPD
jgi:hypothetical protein